MAITVLTKDNFEAEALKSLKPVLIDFWAPWCGPCRMLGPVLEELDKENLVKIGKVNVDEEDDLSAAFGISSIPALFLVKDGKVVKKTLGYQGLEALKEFVK
jgi:thioredoxin 1